MSDFMKYELERANKRAASERLNAASALLAEKSSIKERTGCIKYGRKSKNRLRSTLTIFHKITKTREL